MRAVAKRVPIKILWMGEYVRSEEQYKPHYVKFQDMEIARAHIMGVVVDKYTNEQNQYISLILDDGTGQVRVKLFGEDTKFGKDVNVGDLVRAIGKVRENEDERYLVGEIVKKLEDPNWELLWKLEVIKPFAELLNKPSKEEEGKKPESEEIEEEKGKKESEKQEKTKTEKNKEEKDIKDVSENEEEVDEDLLEIEEIEV